VAFLNSFKTFYVPLRNSTRDLFNTMLYKEPTRRDFGSILGNCPT